MVDVGDIAPDFTLQDQNGNEVTLSGFRGNKNVVMFFYPKDNTPVCTKESCTFRDNYESITSTDAEVLGISGDSNQSHAAFAKKHGLQFPLLSDKGHEIAKRYGAMGMLMPGRITLVVDKTGKIRHITKARFKAQVHINEAKAALEKL